MGDKMTTPDGKLSTAWIRNSGNGLNVPTKLSPTIWEVSGLSSTQMEKWWSVMTLSIRIEME